MKTLVKLINIHDGNEDVKQNGERLYIATYPRAEKIISAFLTNGWKLTDRTQLYNPAIQKNGSYSFYLGGWDFLFEKVVEDDAEDDSDKILEDVLKEILPQEEPPFSEDDFIIAENDDENFEFFDDDEF